MNKRETITTTFQGEEIQCCKFTIDTTPAIFRFSTVLQGSGDYAWQWIIWTENSNKSVQLFMGNKISIIQFGTTARKWTNVYKDVDTSLLGGNVDIKFSTAGTYYCYHTKLEKGDTVTNWTESDVDLTYSMVQQTADMLSWIVASGDSASTFTLTPRTAELVAQFINLNGLVAFGALTQEIKNLLFPSDSEKGEMRLVENHDSGSHEKALSVYCYPTDNNKTTIHLHLYDSQYQIYGLYTVLMHSGVIVDMDLYKSRFDNDPDYEYGMTIYHTVYYSSDSIQSYYDVWYNPSTDGYSAVEYTYNDQQQKVTSTTYIADFQWDIEHHNIIAQWDYTPDTGEIELFQQYPDAYVWDAENQMPIKCNLTYDDMTSLKLAKLCSDYNLTFINGGKILTGSVTADKINVNSLQAISAILGGFTIVDDSITNTNSSTDITQNPQIKFERNTGNAYEYAYVIYSFPTYELYYRDVVTNMSSHYPTDVKISINDKGSMTWKYNLYPSTGTDLPEESDYEATPTQTYDNSMGLPLELGSDIFSHYYGNGVDFEVAQGKQIKMYKTNQAVGETPTLEIGGTLKTDSLDCTRFNNIYHDKHSFTIAAGQGNGFALQIPISTIGNNPIVQITSSTKYFGIDFSVSTSGTNKVISVTVLNSNSSSQSGDIYTTLFYHN